ncbi:MAG: hypothetical protein RSF67_07385 [Clostridia bacterium]
MKIKIKVNILLRIAFIFMLLNIGIFIIGWLRVYYSIPLFLLLLIVFFILFRMTDKIDEIIIIDFKFLLISMIIIFAWCVFSGQGGLFYQQGDWEARNPIYHDLIQYDWPVFYSDNSMLCYYIGYWQIPALICKILNCNIFFSDIILLFYTFFSILLIYLLLIRITKANSVGKQITVLIVFIFFSGWDFIPQFIHNWKHGLPFINGDLVFSEKYYLTIANAQYNANSTELSWVFNQAIPAWISACLFIILKDNKRFYAIILLPLIFFSPFVFIGFSFILISVLIKEYIIDKSFIWKDIFCAANLLQFSYFIVFLLYYLSNLLTPKMNEAGMQFKFQFINISIIWYLLFVFFEFFIFTMLIYRRYIKDEVFISVNLLLLILPFFVYGKYNDLCMRAAIVPLFILMIYCIDYLLTSNNWQKYALILALTLGSSVPIFFNYIHGLNELIMYKQKINDPYFTFDNILTKTTSPAILNNYFSKDTEKTPFFVIMKH